MFLNSPITLCGRVDLDADRFFSGRLAELSIFDNALTKQQVQLSECMSTRHWHQPHVPHDMPNMWLTHCYCRHAEMA